MDCLSDGEEDFGPSNIRLLRRCDHDDDHGGSYEKRRWVILLFSLQARRREGGRVGTCHWLRAQWFASGSDMLIGIGGSHLQKDKFRNGDGQLVRRGTELPIFTLQ